MLGISQPTAWLNEIMWWVYEGNEKLWLLAFLRSATKENDTQRMLYMRF